MTSKILFIVLIGCAVAFESPINDQTGDTGKEEEIIEHFTKFLDHLIDQIFERAMQNIKLIKGNENEGLEEIDKRLNSTVYKEAVVELSGIFKRHEGHAVKPHVSQAERRLVKQECEKVGAALEQLFQAAIEKFKNNSDENVDATEFKKAVDNLKKVVDNIYA